MGYVTSNTFMDQLYRLDKINLEGDNMIMYINGKLVSGTPEELKRWEELQAKQPKNNKFFNIPEDGVPEHVKRYNGGVIYESKDPKVNIWY